MQELFHKPVPGNGHTNKKTDAARQVGGVVQGGGEEHTGQNRETDRREMERERERETDRERERGREPEYTAHNQYFQIQILPT